jgi:hypothetical protein
MKKMNKILLAGGIGSAMLYLTIYLAVLNLLVSYTPYIVSMLGSFALWLISFFKS